MSILRGTWPNTPIWATERRVPEFLVGVDSSERAVSYASKYGAFDEVRHARAFKLPAADKEFETSLSIENIEHLWAEEVLEGMKELVRVASRQVLITTPWPWDVSNIGWLTQERDQALRDEIPLFAEEFGVLTGAIHKSTISPEQFAAAGFRCLTPGGITGPNGLYEGDPTKLDLDQLGAIAGMANPIPKVEMDPKADLRGLYLKVLDEAIRWAPQVSEPPGRVRISRSIRGAGTSTWIAVGKVVSRIEGKRSPSA
jgi:hypothetical protein